MSRLRVTCPLHPGACGRRAFCESARLAGGSVEVRQHLVFRLLVLVMSWTAPSICVAVEQQAGSLKSADVLPDRPSGLEAFRCADHFGPASTRAALRALFGAREVVTQEMFHGGDTKDVTVLFPKDPARRMFIEWRDPSKQQGIKSISIIGHSWDLDGLTIGAPLIRASRSIRGHSC